MTYTQALAAADFIRSRAARLAPPRVGIILGTGFGGFATSVTDSVTINYRDVPHLPQSAVAGHAGKLSLGTVAGVPVAVLQGRVHLYEGYTAAEVSFATRVLALLGCRVLVVTNAAGGIDPALAPGSLVLLSDHINLTGVNAAGGPNEPRFATSPGTGQRFFDMSDAYSPRLRAIARAHAQTLGFALPEGVYVAVSGPSFETPAEIRAFRSMGADLVGMSTVHEAIVARHMGLEVLALSLVTNPAAGVSPAPIDHDEVLEVGRRAEDRLKALLVALMPQIDPQSPPSPAVPPAAR